ncbi:MAG: CRISPR-associated endonuclease Cas2 [Methanobacteriaceae archaeon]|jgi:CRISPR-associated protein Cas2|nr:CRISPR-associated endonuclease Cas2 [Candidatus Methanorudis spinitermitis]
MLVFVIYDISDNKSRLTLIKKLQHFGLHRVQKSAFSGILTLKDRFKLCDEIELYLSSEKDSIIIIPICDSCGKSIEVFSDGNLFLPHEKEYKLV